MIKVRGCIHLQHHSIKTIKEIKRITVQTKNNKAEEQSSALLLYKF